MLKLVVPEKLKLEFATVESLWRSCATTRRTDALLLSWVKYEKQLRRLFCFLVFQHPRITRGTIDEVISTMAKNSKLSPETFLKGIENLGVASVASLLGVTHDRLWPEIKRIKNIRNKLMHGQITGQSVRSTQLERDVLILIEWINSLADAADSAYGYDGLKRNTFSVAKSAKVVPVAAYPFRDVAAFKSWLKWVAK